MYISGLSTRDLQALGKRSIARHLALLCAAIVLPTLILIALLAWFTADRLITETASVLRARAQSRDCPCSEPLPGEYPDPAPAPAKVESAARKVH